jgi:site-specific DNA-methyltransferase (adenine-specific)
MKPYYQDDRAGITIYHGDCLEVQPLLSPWVDLILSDLPYGTTACAWDSAIFLPLLWEQYKRLIKPSGAVVLTASQPFTTTLISSNLGWFRYCWVWEKDTPTGFLDANRKPLKAHEDVCVFYQSQPTYHPQKWRGQPNHSRRADVTRKVSSIYGGERLQLGSDESGMKYPRSVLRFAKHSASEDLHPAQKPIELIAYLIRTYTNPGDLVLDSTTGSGTTLEAAKRLGRRAIGIEIEERYCDIAARRLQQEVMAL